MNFVKTTDSETADLLRKAGLQEVEGGVAGFYVFINDPSKYNANFAKDNKDKKIIYSNILSF